MNKVPPTKVIARPSKSPDRDLIYFGVSGDGDTASNRDGAVRPRRQDDNLTEACLGQVSEIFHGDSPHTRGCIAQALGRCQTSARGAKRLARELAKSDC